MNDTPARCGVIGFPLAHTRSPELHNRFAEQCGIAQSYSVLAVPDADFEHVARTFFTDGGQGLNVTLPYKSRAMDLADIVSERAARAGAANVLTRREDGAVHADNVDGVGFLNDLGRRRIDPRGMRVCILGAGGAAAGVAAALLEAGVGSLAVRNRNPGRARAMAARLDDERIRVLPVKDEAFDLLLNATSASLANQCPDFPDALIGPRTLAYDLVYTAEPTPFMQRAAQLGARTCDGWGMLVEQAAESFRLWHGTRPDTSALFRRP